MIQCIVCRPRLCENIWELVDLHEDLPRAQEFEAPLPGICFPTMTLTLMQRTREDPADFGVTFSGGELQNLRTTLMNR